METGREVRSLVFFPLAEKQTLLCQGTLTYYLFLIQNGVVQYGYS